MSSIDKRVVQMQFDNAQFQAGIKQSLNSLKNLDESLKLKNGTSGFEQAQKAAEGFAKNNGIEQAVESIQSKFSAFGAVAFTVLQRITNASIDCAKNLANMLVVQPIMEGFAEYEQGIGSTQTIVNATGESLDRVNEKLGELNEYSDRTIYKFSDMTGAIGKFTNAGVSLDDAVLAIKGISNEAALAGATTNQASSAMYNFSQALSTGYLGLMDWRSIENAMMATQGFREELIKTGVEMGTLVEQNGKYISTTTSATGAISKEFDAMSGFRDSLQSQWITNDVLIATLARYGDETEEIGRKAYMAATEVKTFSQLVDTAAEAMGTGWADSFKLIIGNYEEAKDLWTGVAHVLDGMISSYHNARNAQLEMWRDMGGRDLLIQGISDAWQGLSSRLGAIKEGFDQAFPDKRAEILYAISEAVSKFGAAIKASDENITSIRENSAKFFGALSKIFGSVFTVAGKLLTPIKQMLPLLGAIGNLLGSVFGGLGKVALWFLDGIGTAMDAFADAMFRVELPAEGMITALNTAADRVRSFFNGIQNGLPSLETFKDGMQATFGFIPNLVQKATDSVSNFIDNLKNKFNKSEDDTKKFSEKILDEYDKVEQDFKDVEVKTPILDYIKTFFTDLYNGLTNFLSTLTFRDVVNAWVGLVAAGWLGVVAQLTGTLKNLGKDIGDGLKGFLDGIKEGTKGAKESIDPIKEALQSLQPIIQAYANEINAKALVSVAIAVAVLAASVLVLSNIDAGKLRNAVLAVSTLMGVLLGISTLAVYISGLGKKTDKAADTVKGIKGKFFGALKTLGNGIMEFAAMFKALTFMTLVSIAVLNLAKAVAAIAQVGDPVAVATATVVVGLLMGMMSILYNSLRNIKVKNVTGQIGVMLTTAIALRELIHAVAEAGDMNPQQAATGLLSMGIVLAMFVKTINSLQNISVNPGVIVALATIAMSMSVLGFVLKQLSTIGWEGIASGLVGLGGAMAALIGGVIVLNKYQGSTDVGKVMELIVMTGIIASLGRTLSNIASIGWEGIAQGLTGMGAALTLFVGAIVVLNKTDTNYNVGTALMMVSMALTVKILGSALMELSTLSWEAIATGLVAMGGALLIFIGAIAVLNGIEGGGINIGSLLAMVTMAITLAVLGSSLQAIAGIGWEGIGVALTAMLGALSILVVVTGIMSLVGPMAIVGAASLLIASLSLLAITQALNSLETESLGEKIGALGATLGILAVALTLMIAAIPGAVALLIVSTGLSGLASGLQAMSSVDPSAGEKVGQVCMGMALGLTAMIAAIPGAAALMIVAASLPMLATGLKALDKVGDPAEAGNKIRDLCLALAAGLTAMIASLPGAAALAVAAPALVQLAPALKKYQELDMWGITAGLTPLLAGIAAGLVAMTAGIVGAAALVVAAAGLSALLPVIQQYQSMDMGSVSTMLGDFLKMLGETLTGLIPAMGGAAALMVISAGLSMLFGVLMSMQSMDLTGQSQQLRDLGTTLSDFMTQMSGLDSGIFYTLGGGLVALAGGMGVASGAVIGFSTSVGMAASTIAGDTDTIISNVGRLESEVGSTGGRIAQQAVSDVTNASSQVISQLSSMFSEVNSQVSNGMNNAANQIQNGLSRISAMSSQAYNAGRDVMMGVVNGLKSVSVDGYSIGQNLVSAAISGASSMAGAAYSAGASLGANLSSGLKNNLVVASPSKVGIDIGKNFGLGVIIGVKNKMHEASLVGSEFGNVVGASLQELMDNVERFTAMNLTPTITPVIDGADVNSGMNVIRDQLNNVGFNVGGINAVFDNSAVITRMDDIIRKMDELQNGVNITINGEMLDDESIRDAVFDLLDQVQRAGRM